MSGPLTRVLDRVPADQVDQAPPAGPYNGHDCVSVASECESCGCRWIVAPGQVLPEGQALCGACGHWRRVVYRDRSLAEFNGGASA